MNERRIREEVANVMLALITRKLGVSANAETILSSGKHRPDVMFPMHGVRVILEGKFADSPDAKKTVLNDAKKRVQAGISHIAVAVIYPIEIRSLEIDEISEKLANSRLQYLVVDETFNEEQWLEGTPTQIMETIRWTHANLAKDEVVETTAASLADHLDWISDLWTEYTGICNRLTIILGMSKPEIEKPKEEQDRKHMVSKISALVLANAFIFQEQLSLRDERVDTLQKTKNKKNLLVSISSHWQWIADNINYIPIFKIAQDILDELTSVPEISKTLKVLMEEAQSICESNAALRHDLMGRIYHWLLNDRKYLGTYYTSVSAATLLLKVTFNQKWNFDFCSQREITNFKIADFACGTGTLLMASTRAITDKFISERYISNERIDERTLTTLHSSLMQNIIHGCDVLPTAINLTASTLALLAPKVAFRKMNLYPMPFGLINDKPRMGSLDFYESDEVKLDIDIVNTQIDSATSSDSYSCASVPELDLCVMNPPFTGTHYGNKIFGNIPENERKVLLNSLRKITKEYGVGLKAGLGAAFVPLGDLYTKPGGRIAFVLPIALASGESWKGVRDYISQRYHLEIVISSHDPNRWNFSENTKLSEILFVARKLKKGETPGSTAFFSLWNNPRTIYGALDVADRISEALNVKTNEFEPITLKSGDKTFGEMIKVPVPKGSENWTNTLFAQGQLSIIHRNLHDKSELTIPGTQVTNTLPLCPLHELGEIGYDVRGITDAFEADRTKQNWSPYSGFYDHKADHVVQITQTPNSTLSPKKNHVQNANKIWNKAGKILIVSRLRTTTHRVVAVGFSKKVLGNTWWAFDDSKLNKEQRKALLIWFNSTIGIFSYYGRRAITEGAWMQMKKPGWENMPVLNVKKLSQKKLSILANTYDKISKKKLFSICQLENDKVRIEIDKSIEKAFKLPSFKNLRELLAREPGFSEREIGSL